METAAVPPAKPLLIRNTIEASRADNIQPGTRVILNWDGLDRVTLSDALAIQTVSGWTVSHDYRPDGSDILLLEGRDWHGNTRYMPTSVNLIRVEIESA